MKQEELQHIILAILHYLHDKTDSNNLEEIIKKVQKDTSLLDDIDYKDQSLLQTLNMLKNEYKEVALQSIDSFAESNSNIQEITKIHEERFEKLYKTNDAGVVNIDIIKEKFSDMYDHITQEIKHANNEIAQLRKKVKELEENTNIDPLTKIYNRRALNEYLNKVCTLNALKKDIHLLMFDIDNFKEINDIYGHLAGDKIIFFIAQILKKMLRKGDKIFRYGGEEFVIVLHHISEKNCIKAAKRILKLISNNTFVYKQNTIRVTISMGGTKLRQDDSPSTLLERADKALYKAKNDGKNRFVQYEKEL